MRLNRETLQAIRDTALEPGQSISPFWREAFVSLAKEADRIDAMLARFGVDEFEDIFRGENVLKDPDNEAV